jgi:hypothetical protein
LVWRGSVAECRPRRVERPGAGVASPEWCSSVRVKMTGSFDSTGKASRHSVRMTARLRLRSTRGWRNNIDNIAPHHPDRTTRLSHSVRDRDQQETRMTVGSRCGRGVA